MMITEMEAREKICPFMGVLSMGGNPKEGNCITNDCMAWKSIKSKYQCCGIISCGVCLSCSKKYYSQDLEGQTCKNMVDAIETGYCMRLSEGDRNV